MSMMLSPKGASAIATFLALLCAAACGQTSNGEPGPGLTGGSSSAEAGAGGRGGSSSGGAQSGSNSAGVGGEGGGPARVPGETDEEAQILEPLFQDESALDNASGEALARLAVSIGLARGYALCRCVFAPGEPPASTMNLVRTCARDEAGSIGRAYRGDATRCLGEALAADPALEDAVRCRSTEVMSDGRRWLEVCWQERSPDEPFMLPSLPNTPSPACSSSERLDLVLHVCQSVHYCADGRRVDGGLCDAIVDCEDETDERGCFEVRGRDMVQCGDEIHGALDICEPNACPAAAAHCDETRPNVFSCDDGVDVSTNQVCDRVDDCANGADELYCLR
jgi:hypothetical protein